VVLGRPISRKLEARGFNYILVDPTNSVSPIGDHCTVGIQNLDQVRYWTARLTREQVICTHEPTLIKVPRIDHRPK